MVARSLHPRAAACCWEAHRDYWTWPPEIEVLVIEPGVGTPSPGFVDLTRQAPHAVFRYVKPQGRWCRICRPRRIRPPPPRRPARPRASRPPAAEAHGLAVHETEIGQHRAG